MVFIVTIFKGLFFCFIVCYNWEATPSKDLLKKTIFPLFLLVLQPLQGVFIWREHMKSYIIHKDWTLTASQFIKKGVLSHEEAGILLEAIFDYQLYGTVDELLSDKVLLVLMPLIDQFRRDEEKYNEKVERNKKNGIKGGRPPKEEKTIEKPPVEPVPKVPKAPKPPKAPSLFEDFYALYPRKEAKQNALKAYQKALKQVSHKTIIEGVSKYKQQIEAKQIEKQYIKQPATWLNAGCWDDEYGFATSTTASTDDYDALLAKIKSVMDENGNFKHGVENLNFYSIKDSIGANGDGYKIYYDQNGVLGHKVIYLHAIGEKTHAHS